MSGMREVRITLGPEPIEPEMHSPDSDTGYGASCDFTGRVRAVNFGRQVTAVVYDLFEPLARKTLEKIALEALTSCETEGKVLIRHRSGPVAVGELSVWIRALTPHRDEAFRVCREVIERLKHEAPIWKKEVYTDGETEWLKGHSLCSGGRSHAE
jgi:molybdopterin synthase catalytic subunit